MEPTTCVVDASTLVEHIQEIKRWIQHGRLRLVMPLCTMDNVKRIWSKEIKVREQQRRALTLQKSTGKSARRVQPTYDNNPRVTLEFLNRLRAENGDGLVFQREGEEYSPWQRTQTPPRRQVQEERPATFAEAVRHRLNASNGTSGAPGATKGPAKAKLVARASATDMSPWTMNKSAPRALPDSVPAALRPLLSYTLWRLYEERHTLGVGNMCILLTNDVVTYNVAQTLTICVATIPEIRQVIASQTKVEDLDSFGDLEREFGRREFIPKRDLSWRKLKPKALEANNEDVLDGSTDDQNGIAVDQEDSTGDQNGIVVDQEGSTGDQNGIVIDQEGSTGDQNGDDDTPGSQLIVHPLTNRDLTIKDTDTGVPEIESSITKMEELPVISEDRKSVQKWLTTAGSAVPLMRIEDTETTGLNSTGHEKPVDTLCYVEDASALTEEETIEKSANSSTPNFQPVETQGNDWPENEGMIDTPTMASGLATNETAASTTVDDGVSTSAIFSAEPKHVSPQEADCQNQLCSSPSAASSGSMPCSPRLSSETNSLSTTEAQEQEDSDEEVVVFNPRAKRWSSQSKPITKEIPQSTSPAKTLNSRNLAAGFESPPRKGPSNRVPVTPSPTSHAQASLLPPNKSPCDHISGEQSSRGQGYCDQAHNKQGLRTHSPRNNSPRNNSPRNNSPRNNSPRNNSPQNNNLLNNSSRNRSPRNQVPRKQGRPNQPPPNRAPPAIIDPDFFGRSPVVNVRPNGQNGQGRYFHRGSPRRGPRGGHEADVEYVLTSGSTREATRGKGKLWVPS